MPVYQELATAVEQLENRFDWLKVAARERLGRLYNSLRLPESLRGLFAISWEFPSVEPPESAGTQNQWWADLGPVDGPTLGPFLWRSDALAAERDWLEAHWRPSC